LIDPHVCYSPPQAIRESRLPRAFLYEALDSGELRAIRRGRRWLIPGAALIRFLEELGAEDGRR